MSFEQFEINIKKQFKAMLRAALDEQAKAYKTIILELERENMELRELIEVFQGKPHER